MLYLKQKKIPIMLGLLVLAFFLWVEVSEGLLYRGIQRLEAIIYDTKLRHLSPSSSIEDAKNKILIVAIDETSLNTYGRWPWSRNILVELIDNLKAYRVTLIGLDLVFSEPSLAEHDQLLAKKLSETESVLGFILHNQPQLITRTPVKYIRPLGQTELDVSDIPQLTGITANIPAIQKSAKSVGFLTTYRDADGSLRKVPLVLRFAGNLYTAFAFEVARQYLLVDSPKLVLGKIGQKHLLEGIKLDTLNIPVNRFGELYVPYKKKAFEQVSAIDVLQKRVPLESLENAIVIVGVTALGISDLMVTPVDPVMPGVEVHANILSSILNQNFIHQPSWLKGAYVILILSLGLLLTFAMPTLGAISLLISSLVTLSILVMGGLWIWGQWSIKVDTLTAIFLVFSQSLINMIYGFYAQSKDRQAIKKLFGQYVDPRHISEMAMSDADDYGLAGESREMTILFADIRNFTQYAETLGPEKLKALLNDYFTPMTQIVFEQGGTIDKYVGDMLIAFWGAPMLNPYHSEAALSTAFKMLSELKSINQGLNQKGFPTLNIGIGVNTGTVTVGDMGSDFRRSYTVLGDNVNLAAFFEHLTKHYHLPLIVGENTVLSTPSYAYRFLEKVKLKGRAHLVAAYEPLGLISDMSQSQLEELDEYERALAYYFEKAWSSAEKAFQTLVTQHPDIMIYQQYLENTRSHKANGVSAYWDGSVRVNL